MLRNLSAAPLKPPQRMQILKVHLLPKLDHRLALSAINKGLLRRLDRMVRREVIRCLHLPRRGVPLEFFHSPVMYGGLGVRSYAGTMVDINDRRLNLLIRNNHPYAKWLVSDSHWSQRWRDRTEDRTVVENNDQNEPVAAENENVRDTRRKGDDLTRYKPHKEDPNLIDLYEKCGYEGLKWQPHVPQSSLWIDCWKRRLHITGWDYTKAILARGSLMATPARKARIGLTASPNCPTCPAWIGTAAHCLQSCPRTHGARIARHDYVLDHLVRSLRHRDSEVKVLLAPRIPAGQSHVEPDVVFWFPSAFPRVAYCVDAAVCSEECNPNSLHETKVRKYDQPEVSSWIKRHSGMTTVEYGSVVLTWRGTWSASSANWLTEFPRQFLRHRDLAIMSLRTLIGSWKCWAAWQAHAGGRPDANRNRHDFRNRQPP